LLTESALLAASGGLLGFVLTIAACRFVSSLDFGIDLPFNTTLEPNFAVWLYTLGVASLATLLFGFAPALHSARTDVVPGLKGAVLAGRRKAWNIRDLFVAGQIALSVMLVVSSFLVVRSLQ